MGTKMAVAFANIFMGTVESQILHRSILKPPCLEKVYWWYILDLEYKQRPSHAIHWTSK